MRDTGASQSFVFDRVLPFSNDTLCGSDGAGNTIFFFPHSLAYLDSGILSGIVRVGVHSGLLVKGVNLILGYDVTGG